jgi:hypothetical protein
LIKEIEGFMNIHDLESDIEKRKRELEELKNSLQEEKKKRKNLPYSEETLRLAEVLHEKFCVHNHEDGCGWYYDDGSWTEYSRQEYIKKATKLLKISDLVSLIDIIEIIGD